MLARGERHRHAYIGRALPFIRTSTEGENPAAPRELKPSQQRSTVSVAEPPPVLPLLPVRSCTALSSG